MSYTILDNEIFEDVTLKHTEFRVLTFLIRNYNISMGYSFPTREQIIISCKINKDTLGNVLNSLEKKGYITRKNNPLKSGRNNLYIIHKYLVVTSENNIVEQVKNEDHSVENIEIDDDEKLIANYITKKIVYKRSEEDLRQKIETVEGVVGRKINQGFINILSKLTWDELIKIDMSLSGKTVNESYYLGAIHRLRPDLKCII